MDIESAATILGISPSASLTDIKTAYRDLAQVWHPDRFGHNPRLMEKAEETLKNINSAYRLLLSSFESAGQSRPGPSAPPYSDNVPRNEPPSPHNHYDKSESRRLHNLIDNLRAALMRLTTNEVTLARMRRDLDHFADEIAKFDNALSIKIKRSLVQADEVAARRRALEVLDYLRKHVSQCRICGLSFTTGTTSKLCQECWRAELRKA